MPTHHIDRTNAERFIVAYNRIDHAIRSIYGFKRTISYADLIRKAVTLNSVVRKYEDELIDYGRLRNSIVHKTNPNYVIAEHMTKSFWSLKRLQNLSRLHQQRLTKYASTKCIFVTKV